MREYSITNAKNDLPSIVQAVERGEAVRLTRGGRPVAMIVSVEEYRSLTHEPKSFMERYREWRRTATFGTDGITGDEFDIVREKETGEDRTPVW